ncbi:MAG: PASTA domain-containing protein, partial [Candidatus Hydrogenedentes bacterium]|nr:PASTA domain-containing protein [Candidatus Hydrogenedentota bacterium]
GEQGVGELAELDLPFFEPGTFEEDFEGLELIPAQEDKSHAGPRLPDFGGMTKWEAKALVVSLGLSWDPQGAGRVVRQKPAPGTPLQEVRLCELLFSNG